MEEYFECKKHHLPNEYYIPETKKLACLACGLDYCKDGKNSFVKLPKLTEEIMNKITKRIGDYKLMKRNTRRMSVRYRDHIEKFQQLQDYNIKLGEEIISETRKSIDMVNKELAKSSQKLCKMLSKISIFAGNINKQQENFEKIFSDYQQHTRSGLNIVQMEIITENDISELEKESKKLINPLLKTFDDPKGVLSRILTTSISRILDQKFNLDYNVEILRLTNKIEKLENRLKDANTKIKKLKSSTKKNEKTINKLNAEIYDSQKPEGLKHNRNYRNERNYYDRDKMSCFPGKEEEKDRVFALKSKLPNSKKKMKLLSNKINFPEYIYGKIKTNIFALNISNYKITNTNIKVPNDSFVIQNAEGKVFISGGFEFDKPLSRVSEYFPKISFKARAPMTFPRSDHSQVKIWDNNFLTVGGYSVNGMTNTCEIYSVTENIWESFSSLNEPKAQVGLEAFHDLEVYCFGGITSSIANTKIEVFDLYNMEFGWRIIGSLSSMQDPFIKPWLFFNLDKELLIVQQQGKGYSFNISNKVLSKKEGIDFKADTFCNPTYRIESKLLTFGDSGVIHIFELKQNMYQYKKGF